MLRWSTKPERLLAAAVVVALHVVLLRLLLRRTVPTALPSTEPPLLITIFAPAKPRRVVRPHHSSAMSKIRTSPQEHQAPRNVIAQPIAISNVSKIFPRVPINWQQAMHAEVHAFELRSDEQPKVHFGSPKMPTPPEAPYRFPWDEARLHPIVIKPGAILIHFGDVCTINLTFPIPICHFHTKANGNLFKHMNNPRAQGPGALL